MTYLQVSLLSRAARKDAGLPGTASMMEEQSGRQRQINWLLNRGLIRRYGGRLVATQSGRKILAHQQS